jgi:hypothetical protein
VAHLLYRGINDYPAHRRIFFITVSTVVPKKSGGTEMSFYYTVTYSFDPSRRLVGPFKDEESCWKAMEEDANHEHEEDLRNDMISIVEKYKNVGEIVIKTPNELDDVPDTTTWSMSVSRIF